jgi:hypothetical protein
MGDGCRGQPVCGGGSGGGVHFCPARLFFGMVTPYAIRLRIESVDSSGATVGRLYALSTAGSIVGTFLGGFILISFLGSTSILWGVAAAMLGLSLCNGGGRVRLRAVLLAVCGLSGCGGGKLWPLAGWQGHEPSRGKPL